MKILGIDIGGSGIKGAPVDLETGTLVEERHRIATPHPATRKAVADTVAQLVDHFGWDGPLGCAFPARVKHGVATTAANIPHAWIGTDVDALLTERTGLSCTVVNDADAAGVAELHFGAGRDERGLAILLTFGTGIGSAFFFRQVLIPNLELGHIEMKGAEAEAYAADRIRKKEDLSWHDWALRVQEYLAYLEFLFDPDLIILGGGISKKKKTDKYLHLLTTHARLVPAQLRNEAGIIGAAYYASVEGRK